jgi:PKD repeat protein
MAATTVILAAAWGCSDNGSNTGPNTNPTASFTAPACIAGTACAFTDASTDADGTVTAWSWNFNDGTALDVNRNPSHTFATAGTFNVTLTVTDNAGGTGSTTVPVTVTGGTPNNLPPTASFTAPACTVNTACQFTDASTDSDGTVTAWSWNFGDGTAADINQSPTHTFGAAGTYQVSLTVTDDKGAASTPVTQAVTVSSGSSSACASDGVTVTCSLTITAPSTVTVTLMGTSCELRSNNVRALAPNAPGAPRVSQALWNDACRARVGDQVIIQDVNGAPLVLQAGQTLQIILIQGTPGVTDPTPGPAAGNIVGAASPWTISFEDGGNPAGLGEPDNNDVVLSIQATPQ